MQPTISRIKGQRSPFFKLEFLAAIDIRNKEFIRNLCTAPVDVIAVLLFLRFYLSKGGEMLVLRNPFHRTHILEVLGLDFGQFGPITEVLRLDFGQFGPFFGGSGP